MTITKLINILSIVLVLSACAQTAPSNSREDPFTIDDVYQHVNRNFENENTINDLRQRLVTDHSSGIKDPQKSIRIPEVIMPVWHFTTTHPIKGSRIEGTWETLILQEAKWAE